MPDYNPAQQLTASNFASPQSDLQPAPVTMAAAANIVPTTKMTFLTGTAQLKTIGTIVNEGEVDEYVEPVQKGYHELVFVFTNVAPGLFLTTGNIKTAYQPIQNRPVTLYYNPIDKLYWVQTVS